MHKWKISHISLFLLLQNLTAEGLKGEKTFRVRYNSAIKSNGPLIFANVKSVFDAFFGLPALDIGVAIWP